MMTPILTTLSASGGTAMGATTRRRVKTCSCNSACPLNGPAAMRRSRTGGGQSLTKVGKGGVIWMHENPAGLAKTAEGDARLAATVKQAARQAGLKWRETNYLLLRRGPYVLAAGLDESVAGEPRHCVAGSSTCSTPSCGSRSRLASCPVRVCSCSISTPRGATNRKCSPPRVSRYRQNKTRIHFQWRSKAWSIPRLSCWCEPLLPRGPLSLAGQPLESFKYVAGGPTAVDSLHE